MKVARSTQMGWLGAVFVLSVACAGKVRDLGDGGDGAGGDGAGGGVHTGGSRAIGGMPNGGAGGTATTGGQSQMLHAGGTSTVGGAWATGGIASTLIGGALATGGADATGGFDASRGGWQSTATGGRPATGGVAATGGSDASRGGWQGTGGFDATGGMPATGGADASAGGRYGNGGAWVTATGGGYNAYPPALGRPIDKTCKCTATDQVCDGDNQCVARCDANVGCAQWLTNRAVRGLHHDGTSLYYLTARSTDPLGNPVPDRIDGSLYKVTGLTGTPTPIAAGLMEPHQILGRYATSTFVTVFDGIKTYSVVEVTDAGTSTKLADSYLSKMSLQGAWLIYVHTDGNQLRGINLATGRTAMSLGVVEVGSFRDLIVVGDHAIAQLGTLDACVASLSSPTAAPTCGIGVLASSQGALKSADNTRIFFGSNDRAHLRAYDTAGNAQLILFNDPDLTSLGATQFVNGWLYSAPQGTWTRPKLVRYPTTLGRLPQEILASGYGSDLFAVGKTEVYWAYPAEKANSVQYIFQRSLPAQPCDEQLTCPINIQACKDGLCVTVPQ